MQSTEPSPRRRTDAGRLPRPHAAGLLITTLMLAVPLVHGSDACSTRAIVAAAEVDVSDGGSFRVESYYHTKDNMAVRHVYPSSLVRTSAIEGPLTWSATDDRASLADKDTALFALGHQFHALLVDFNRLVPDAAGTVVPFEGKNEPARQGRFPYGGSIALIGGGDRPTGMLLRLPEGPDIRVRFSDWRQFDGLALPYDLVVDDGERTFAYRYSYVDPSPRPPTWMFDELEAPALDAVRLYRLHRRLLAAHCLGDAAMLATLSSPTVLVASDGRLASATKLDMQRGFEQLFERLDYARYEDVKPPAIEVSTAGDLAWIAVEVRARGTVRASGIAFDDRWAWIMLARKEAGDWVHAGNASNRRRTP